MGIDRQLEVMAFAIDSNSDSCLLNDLENVVSMTLNDSVPIVPSTKSTYSLFSINSLFLNQD